MNSHFNSFQFAASPSLEQAKGSDAMLSESPSETRPERTERRRARILRTTSLSIWMWNAKAICCAIRGEPQSGLRCFISTTARMSIETRLRWSLLADFPGPHERQPLEHGSVPARIGHVADPGTPLMGTERLTFFGSTCIYRHRSLDLRIAMSFLP